MIPTTLPTISLIEARNRAMRSYVRRSCKLLYLLIVVWLVAMFALFPLPFAVLGILIGGPAWLLLSSSMERRAVRRFLDAYDGTASIRLYHEPNGREVLIVRLPKIGFVYRVGNR